jgi:plasmid stabilization system protein ParE
MVYNIITTDEMDMLLDKCVGYILRKFKSEQAAEHLLSGVESIYDALQRNPMIYRLSDDPFMKVMDYHEAKIDGMDYMIIYRVVDNNVYILGIFHTLENYADKMKIIWNLFNQ